MHRCTTRSLSKTPPQKPTFPLTHIPPQKKLNLTKTVRKLPINQDLERAGRYQFQDDSHHRVGPKYDDEGAVQIPEEDWSQPLTHDNFKDTLTKYDIGMCVHGCMCMVVWLYVHGCVHGRHTVHA